MAGPEKRPAPGRIESARLVIRRPVAADAPAIFARYASDADATRFMAWPRHRHLDQTRHFLAICDEEWERAGTGAYLLVDRAGGELVGSTGLHLQGPDATSTGYILARDAWGRGLATEALLAMVDLADDLGLARLEAHCHLENRASQRVLEKGGFTCEGTLGHRVVFPNLDPDRPLDVRSYVRTGRGAAGSARGA